MKYGNVYKVLMMLFGIAFLSLVYIKLFIREEPYEDLSNSQAIQDAEYTTKKNGVAEISKSENDVGESEKDVAEYTVEGYPNIETIPDENISPEAVTLSPEDIVATCYFTNSENVIDALLPLYAQEILVDSMQKWLNDQGMGDTEELRCVDGSFSEEENRMIFKVEAEKVIKCIYNTERRTWKFEVDQ